MKNSIAVRLVENISEQKPIWEFMEKFTLE